MNCSHCENMREEEYHEYWGLCCTCKLKKADAADGSMGLSHAMIDGIDMDNQTMPWCPIRSVNKEST